MLIGKSADSADNQYLHNLSVQLLYEKAGFIKAGLLSAMMNITLMFVR